MAYLLSGVFRDVSHVNHGRPGVAEVVDGLDGDQGEEEGGVVIVEEGYGDKRWVRLQMPVMVKVDWLRCWAPPVSCTPATVFWMGVGVPGSPPGWSCRVRGGVLALGEPSDAGDLEGEGGVDRDFYVAVPAVHLAGA